MRVATAGWAIPRGVADQFPEAGSGLERYAARLDGVEINSTFYRAHRASTYARWVAGTPDLFRFAVKLPRAITHDARLHETGPLVATFRAQIAPLCDKLGPLLVQLPPSLLFDAGLVEAFLIDLRQIWPETVVCEPRHPSWFEGAADAMLSAYHVGRVAADPARHPAAALPGGWSGVSYWRLHGSPRTYYSPYGDAALSLLAAQARTAAGAQTWIVFDNTASGAAAGDALRLKRLMGA